MTIQIAPRMAKRRLVKDLSGNIVDWYEEGNGGWIVRGREVVNQAKWEEIQQKQRDMAEAIKAPSMAKVDENAPDRTVSAKEGVENLKKMSEQEKKVEKLEKEVSEVNTKLDAILNALNAKS